MFLMPSVSVHGNLSERKGADFLLRVSHFPLLAKNREMFGLDTEDTVQVDYTCGMWRLLDFGLEWMPRLWKVSAPAQPGPLHLSPRDCPSGKGRG